jgi:sugar phosphate isomerase/epimerase
MESLGWVLWAGTVGLDSPVPDRVAAAVAAGCTRVSIGPLDVARAATEGLSAAELGASVRQAGLEIVMDPLMGWADDTPLPGPFAPYGIEDMLAMCEALRAVAVTAIGPFAYDHAAPAELSKRFAALCDRTAEIGARVQFEFMPMTAITDLASAWRIVEGAGRDNGGLMFDTWHFFRGNPDYTRLGRVPGDRIFAVQVADGGADISGSVAEDTFNRLLPGDGVFDLVGVIRALDRIGGLRWIGPEVISPLTAAMPAEDAARLATDRVRELLAAATSTAGDD